MNDALQFLPECGKKAFSDSLPLDLLHWNIMNDSPRDGSFSVDTEREDITIYPTLTARPI